MMKIQIFFFYFLIFLLFIDFFSSATLTTEIFVYHLGSDRYGDGTSCNPFKTIEKAIFYSSKTLGASSTSPVRIVVEEGTARRSPYFPNYSANSQLRNSVRVGVPGIPMMGGTAGTDSTIGLAISSGAVQLVARKVVCEKMQRAAGLKVGHRRRTISTSAGAVNSPDTTDYVNLVPCFADRDGACSVTNRGEAQLSDRRWHELFFFRKRNRNEIVQSTTTTTTNINIFFCLFFRFFLFPFSFFSWLQRSWLWWRCWIFIF